MTQSLSIIGAGAFGAFMLGHLAPHFDVHVYDAGRDVNALAAEHSAKACTLEQAARCDIVIIAVPVRAIADVASQIAQYVQAGQLVMDVASVKCLPAQILADAMPLGVDIIGLHPLFGPQSGKHGIAGFNVSVVNVRGQRDASVVAFLRDVLALNVIECTAQEHDAEVAYTQGVTHMMAKVFAMMDIPDIQQTTKTYNLLQGMVDTIKHDSDALFMAIQTDNPYVRDVKKRFFTAVRDLEKRLDDSQ